jgi:hypothetical protein
MNLAEEVDLEDYVSRPEKISGAEIACVVQEAGMQAVRNNRYVVMTKDFEKGYKANTQKNDKDFDCAHRTARRAALHSTRGFSADARCSCRCRSLPLTTLRRAPTLARARSAALRPVSAPSGARTVHTSVQIVKIRPRLSLSATSPPQPPPRRARGLAASGQAASGGRSRPAGRRLLAVFPDAQNRGHASTRTLTVLCARRARNVMLCYGLLLQLHVHTYTTLHDLR